jgi:hypothetical protein
MHPSYRKAKATNNIGEVKLQTKEAGGTSTQNELTNELSASAAVTCCRRPHRC